MKVFLDIPDKEADFAIKVLNSISFVKKAKTMSPSSIALWEDLKHITEQVPLHKKARSN